MSGRIPSLTEARFETEIVNGAGIQLVEFSSPWCAPCAALEPVLEEIRAAHSGVLAVSKVDIFAEPALAQRWNVRTTPTIIAFRAGAPVLRLVGRTKRHLLEELRPLLG